MPGRSHHSFLHSSPAWPCNRLWERDPARYTHDRRRLTGRDVLRTETGKKHVESVSHPSQGTASPGAAGDRRRRRRQKDHGRAGPAGHASRNIQRHENGGGKQDRTAEKKQQRENNSPTEQGQTGTARYLSAAARAVQIRSRDRSRYCRRRCFSGRPAGRVCACAGRAGGAPEEKCQGNGVCAAGGDVRVSCVLRGQSFLSAWCVAWSPLMPARKDVFCRDCEKFCKKSELWFSGQSTADWRCHEHTWL